MRLHVGVPPGAGAARVPQPAAAARRAEGARPDGGVKENTVAPVKDNNNASRQYVVVVVGKEI